MRRRLFVCFLTILFVAGSVRAGDFIKWVEFDVSGGAMERALRLDLSSREEDQPIGWIDILALAATHTGGGKFSVAAVEKAAKELRAGQSVQELLKDQYKYYQYYHEAYTAVLGGLVGSYAIEKTDETGQKYWQPCYGIKAFSPIASGYWYNHYDDFGSGRSYGFARKHLGNDLMGSYGTPIVAVESGTVEALGWNQYGGWRIGIRSGDTKRYYYYAHLRTDKPYAKGLKEGDRVTAGDVIGFMGRSGYSATENVNNIETVHLHFGMQLVFDESQKECNAEIWIDVYELVRLLDSHRSSVAQIDDGTWERMYPYKDLDAASVSKTLF